jgi:hypothetical protein
LFCVAPPQLHASVLPGCGPQDAAMFSNFSGVRLVYAIKSVGVCVWLSESE